MSETIEAKNTRTSWQDKLLEFYSADELKAKGLIQDSPTNTAARNRVGSLPDLLPPSKSVASSSSTASSLVAKSRRRASVGDVPAVEPSFFSRLFGSVVSDPSPEPSTPSEPETPTEPTEPSSELLRLRQRVVELEEAAATPKTPLLQAETKARSASEAHVEVTDFWRKLEAGAPLPRKCIIDHTPGSACVEGMRTASAAYLLTTIAKVRRSSVCNIANA